MIDFKRFEALVIRKVDYLLGSAIDSTILIALGLQRDWQTINISTFGPRESANDFARKILANVPDLFDTIFDRYFSRIEDQSRLDVLDKRVVERSLSNRKYAVQDLTKKLVFSAAREHAERDFELIKANVNELCAMDRADAIKAIKKAINVEAAIREGDSIAAQECRAQKLLNWYDEKEEELP